ncbi:unnamed protein product [Arabidopsis halleri]
MASNVEFTCFVRGLDQNTDGNDLKNIFSKFGNIIYDHETGKSRRFGFVSFEEEKSMRVAIKEMNDYKSRSKCVNVGSIIVEVARPHRIRRSTGFYQKRRRWPDYKRF